MAAEPPAERDLATQLSKAIDDYRATWQPVDVELYDLCRRRPSQREFPEVYTKVAIIGRVYEAGISRAWRGGGDPESGVTCGLSDVAGLIKSGLDNLADRPFDRRTAGGIVELHGHVTRAISERSGGVWLASFVSKYLHFHCPEVPIYDSNAQAAIGQFVNWQLVAPVRDAMVDLPEWARAYRNFVAAFVILRERIAAETSITASVKETDHLLWQSQRS
jgi:hypothetical protein